jgi:hypothetical protein
MNKLVEFSLLRINYSLVLETKLHGELEIRFVEITTLI